MNKIPKKNEIIVYTDGSSLGNPGNGGWGIIFLTDKKAFEMAGSQKNVTNNQMELEAMYKAFELMTERNIAGYEVNIFSDSKYVITGLTEWIYNWKKNGWKTASKKDVLNKNYWIDISSMMEILENQNNISFFHVKAHNGEKYNERVDDLARFSAEGKNVNKFNGNLSDYLK